LLFSYGDIRKINYFIDQKEDEKERKIAKFHLDALIRFAESYNCRRVQLLNYFGEKYDEENCGMCDNCSIEQKDFTDVTVEAQKFLSCIKRTGEIFGTMHIIDVLRGSNSQKVIAKNHHLLSTYGIGKELSKEQWLNLSKQFIQKNLITKDIEFGSLKITGAGYEVLKGKRTVTGKLKADKPVFAAKPESNLKYNKELFENLRAKRKEIADSLHIPPYAIFPDRTLIEMAAFLPQNNKELLELHGVGRVKLNKYGSRFLKIILHYCRSKEIGRRYIDDSPLMQKRKYELVAEAYNSGVTVEKILTDFSMKFESLIRHLKKYIDEKGKVKPERLLAYIEADKSQQSKVFRLFEKSGTELLRPIYDAMNGTVSYRDLHILRFYYDCKK